MNSSPKSLIDFVRENERAIKNKIRFFKTSFIKKTDLYTDDLDLIERDGSNSQEIALALTKITKISDATTDHGFASNKFLIFKCYLALYQNMPLLRPLLELAAIAGDGLHDLANGNKNNKLTIILDPNSGDVENITARRGSHGVYFHNESTVYIGGRRNLTSEAVGTLMHELTHFLAYEIYKNRCKPYTNGDIQRETAFDIVYKSLEKNIEHLDAILQKAFNYPIEQRHAEIIARTAQLIAMGKTAELDRDCPLLLAYYEKIFLRDCIKHISDVLDKQNNTASDNNNNNVAPMLAFTR